MHPQLNLIRILEIDPGLYDKTNILKIFINKQIEYIFKYVIKMSMGNVLLIMDVLELFEILKTNETICTHTNVAKVNLNKFGIT